MYINEYKLMVVCVLVQDTSIQSLPDGLLAGLSDVAYLSIDLRRNQLKYLHPFVLYGNDSEWESKGTTFVAGGLTSCVSCCLVGEEGETVI